MRRVLDSHSPDCCAMMSVVAVVHACFIAVLQICRSAGQGIVGVGFGSGSVEVAVFWNILGMIMCLSAMAGSKLVKVTVLGGVGVKLHDVRVTQ